MKFFNLTGDSADAGRGVVPTSVTSASSTVLTGVGRMRRFMAISPTRRHGLRSDEEVTAPGAQAGRRGGAGPAGGLLGGKDPAGRFVCPTVAVTSSSAPAPPPP